MKLLNLTTALMLALTLLVLGGGAVALYYVVNDIIVEDVDESLLIKKHELQAGAYLPKPKLDPKPDHHLPHKEREGQGRHDSHRHHKAPKPVRFAIAEGDIEIGSTLPGPVPDSLYLEYRYDPLPRETEPYRTLRGSLLVDGRYRLLHIRIAFIESEDLIEGIVWAQAGLFGVLAVLLILAVSMMARRVWQPFFSILRDARAFRLGHGQALPAHPTRISEFADLGHTLAQLTGSAESAYQTQRAFTENAAHELQTPLAILRGKLQNMIQSPELSHAQAGDISEALATLERMHRLQKSLLLLARIENKQFSLREPIKLDELIRHLLERVEDQLADKQISVIRRLHPATVSADPALVDILVSNLISNAIRHNQIKGSLEIEVNLNSLTIANTGPALPFPAAQIFERFVRSYAAQGSGLGLAISRQVANEYGWQLAYKFEEGRHVFLLAFK